MKTTSEEVYDYVFDNAKCFNGTSLRYCAHINFSGHTFREYGGTPIEARAKLANELSKSKYIQHNFNNSGN